MNVKIILLRLRWWSSDKNNLDDLLAQKKMSSATDCTNIPQTEVSPTLEQGHPMMRPQKFRP